MANGARSMDDDTKELNVEEWGVAFNDLINELIVKCVRSGPSIRSRAQLRRFAAAVLCDAHPSDNGATEGSELARQRIHSISIAAPKFHDGPISIQSPKHYVHGNNSFTLSSKLVSTSLACFNARSHSDVLANMRYFIETLFPPTNSALVVDSYLLDSTFLHLSLVTRNRRSSLFRNFEERQESATEYQFIPLDRDCLVTSAVRSKKVTYYPNLRDAGVLLTKVRAYNSNLDEGSAICAPVVLHDHVSGLIVVRSSEANAFENDAVRLIETTAFLAAEFITMLHYKNQSSSISFENCTDGDSMDDDSSIGSPSSVSNVSINIPVIQTSKSDISKDSNSLKSRMHRSQSVAVLRSASEKTPMLSLDGMPAEQENDNEDERSRYMYLLLNVLPERIADRLGRGDPFIADRVEGCTLVFADICSFTEMCSKMTADAVVNFLNELFSLFDKLLDVYHIEKIKTIGDGYMAATGLLDDANVTRSEDVIRRGAVDMIEFGKAMIRAARIFSKKRGYDVRIRVGINTGPVVAGVIGTRRISYDVFGDTVNVAARVESNGVPNGITISESTYDYIKDVPSISVGPPKVVAMKGKGIQSVYQISFNPDESSEFDCHIDLPDEPNLILSSQAFREHSKHLWSDVHRKVMQAALSLGRRAVLLKKKKIKKPFQNAELLAAVNEAVRRQTVRNMKKEGIMPSERIKNQIEKKQRSSADLFKDANSEMNLETKDRPVVRRGSSPSISFLPVGMDRVPSLGSNMGSTNPLNSFVSSSNAKVAPIIAKPVVLSNADRLEQEQAASKLQSMFRNKKKSPPYAVRIPSESIALDLASPIIMPPLLSDADKLEQDQAATKLQSIFRKTKSTSFNV